MNFRSDALVRGARLRGLCRSAVDGDGAQVPASGGSPAAGARRGSGWVGDVLLAGGLLLWDLWISPVGQRLRGEPVREVLLPAVPILVVASCAPLLVRRRWPLPVLAATAGVMIVGFEVLPGRSNLWLLLSTWEALYTVGVRSDWRTTATATATVLVALSIDDLVGPDRENWQAYLDDLPLLTLLFSAVAGLGQFVRWRGEVARDRERAQARAAEEAAERERRAVGEERARIARELHDVVAHHLSSIVVQAGAAHRVYDEDPEGARAALASIRSTGSETLAAMRRLLGILRTPDGEPDLAPQASLAQLEPLVDHFRQLGLAVTLVVRGSLLSIPVDVDVSAYRVVQEALTNVLKHAGATRVHLEVRHAERFLEVRVDDDGPVSAMDGTGGGGEQELGTRATMLSTHRGGHGLIGMRERLALYAGTLAVGARRGGGWTVRARFPLPGGREGRS